MNRIRWIFGIFLALAFIAGCGMKKGAGGEQLKENKAQVLAGEEADEYESVLWADAGLMAGAAIQEPDWEKAQADRTAELTAPENVWEAGKAEPGNEGEALKAEPEKEGETGKAEPEKEGEALKAEPENKGKAGNAEPGNEGKAAADNIENPADKTTEEIVDEPAKEPETRELTEQELKKLQWSVRGSDNGFFVSTYYRPEEIDWEQIFHDGAGIKLTVTDDQVAFIREQLRADRLEEERKKAELMGIEPEEEDPEAPPVEPEFTEEELALNSSQITALTLRSVQNFVKSRTGMEYSEMRKPLEWPELSRNVFYFIHNDSNYLRFEFLSGTVRGDTYEIYYRKAGWTKEKKPEYVIRFVKEGGKWTFLSNLPVDEAPPITLAEISYLDSKELARMQKPVQLFDVEIIPDEDEYDDDHNASKTADEPQYYWAMVTAAQDNCQVTVERVYHGDEICKELLNERQYVPGEKLGTVTLMAGEKVGVKVTLEDVPNVRISVICDSYYGEYVFGSENRLKRLDENKMPKSTYVYGRDYDGERRGTQYGSEKELLRFLEGTWLFYDGELGEYTATISFDLSGNARIHTLGNDYLLQIFGYDRLYSDVRSAPPDVIKLKATDEETLELFTNYYPFMKKKVGDYRVQTVQMDGEQILILSFENNGKNGLTYLLPGADPLTDGIMLYRFIGTANGDEEAPDGKG